jgi:hypothetical protein
MLLAPASPPMLYGQSTNVVELELDCGPGGDCWPSVSGSKLVPRDRFVAGALRNHAYPMRFLAMSPQFETSRFLEHYDLR